MTVRRHINWDKLQVELTESLAHLVCHIRRQTFGVASAGHALTFIVDLSKGPITDMKI